MADAQEENIQDPLSSSTASNSLCTKRMHSQPPETTENGVDSGSVQRSSQTKAARATRKIRHYSSGYYDENVSTLSVGKTARHQHRHQQHRHIHKHRKSAYKQRQKDADLVRNHQRMAKLDASVGYGQSAHGSAKKPGSSDSPFLASQSNSFREGSFQPIAGGVSVDGDIIYKTLKTKPEANSSQQQQTNCNSNGMLRTSASTTSLNRSMSTVAGGRLSPDMMLKTMIDTNAVDDLFLPAPYRQASDGAALTVDERSAFHKTFSLLVHMGTESGSKRSHHYGGVGCMAKGAVTATSSSESRDDCSEPSSLRQRQIVQFTDILWMYFQARRNGRKLPCCYNDDLDAWLKVEDELIAEHRNQEMEVLDAIANFTLADISDKNDDMARDKFEIITGEMTYDIVAGEFKHEEEVLKKIRRLLARYERMQSLYKNNKAMEIWLGDDLTEDIKWRLKNLYAWSNIGEDLRRKLLAVGDMLEVQKYKNRRDSLPSSRRNSMSVNSVSRSISTEQSNETPRSIYLRHREAPELLATPVTPMTDPLHSPTTSSVPLLMDVVVCVSDLDYLKSFAERSLKLRGMRKVLSRVGAIYGNSLWRARQLLQRRYGKLASFWNVKSSWSQASSPFFELHQNSMLECETDLVKCHVNSEHHLAMRLPSLFPSYLILLRLPLNLVYVWLQLRLEQTTNAEPDALTVNQLIQDARDCLEAATEVKSFYQDYVQAIIDDRRHLETLLVEDISAFEEELKRMFELYLRYVHRRIVHQSSAYSGTTRGVGREQNQSIMKSLESEWRFTKRIAANVLCGDAESAQKFCHMNLTMLKSMEELLENSVDEEKNRQFEEACELEDEDDIGSDDSQSLESYSSGEETHSNFQMKKKPIISVGGFRKVSSIFEQCRRLRTTTNELRNLATRAMALAKLLRNDLEIAGKFMLLCPLEAFLKRLKNTGHVLVKTPVLPPEFLIVCNQTAAENECVLQVLLSIICGQDDRIQSAESTEDTKHQLGGYVLLVRSGDQKGQSTWPGLVKELAPDADSNLTLHHMNVDGVYLIAASSNYLNEAEQAFMKCVSGDVRLVEEQCSWQSIVTENIGEVKKCAFQIRDRFTEWLRKMADEITHNRPLDELEENERQTYRDTLIQAYTVAFEYHRELLRLTNASAQKMIARSFANFALQWCQLVTDICDQGQGFRPRWANDGINYLVQVADPKITMHLQDKEFGELKRIMGRCLNHIIGSRPHTTNQTLFLDAAVTPSGLSSRNTSRSSLGSSGYLDTFQRHNSGSKTSPFDGRNKDDLPDDNDHKDFSAVLQEITKQERERDEQLRSYKRIGRCVEMDEVQPAVQLHLKRTNFRWQRLQTYIGSGRFGTVHTAVNIDSGQLLAVKQMKIKRDHQAMQRLMDEVMLFSKIQHQNLVAYYGAEVHQDEILIFMEYCKGGTLEAACKDAMNEDIVRFYTKALLQAVGELHKHNIVHRDIKPANIFLSNDNLSLKLGDFGSSVRLQGYETTNGELTGHVGTVAYMAPEVCTCAATGYGRAADIWSTGCVVLEMISGKPPWHELMHLSPMSIVYKVGNGNVPTIPESISDLCRTFLSHCLQSKPCERLTVDRLLELQFVKV